MHVLYFREAEEDLELTVGDGKTADVLYDLDINVDSDFLSSWPPAAFLTLPDFKDYEEFFKDLKDDSSSSESENESSTEEKKVWH